MRIMTQQPTKVVIELQKKGSRIWEVCKSDDRLSWKWRVKRRGKKPTGMS